MASFATNIINTIKKATGRKGRITYYDKIKGGYSVKVVGWSRSDCDAAVALATTQGYAAKVVYTPDLDTGFNYRGPLGNARRIHITAKQ